MKKHLSLIFAITIILSLAILLVGCDSVWGDDNQSDDTADYHYVDGKQLTFTLEFRNHGTSSDTASGDKYAHSTLDGELIYSWNIPCYGNTVYESVVKFFEDRQDDINFTLSQHRYYVFDKAVLEDGSEYDLTTSYIAADGVYSKCANFQTLFGEDQTPGTLDDLKVLVVVYQGWM